MSKISSTGALIAVAVGVPLGATAAIVEHQLNDPAPKQTIFQNVDCDVAASSTTYKGGIEGATTYQCTDLPNK